MADPDKPPKRSAPRVWPGSRKPKAGRPQTGRPAGDNPLTSAVDYDDEEFALIRAVDAWRKRTRRTHPSNTELLAILKSLGYRKVEPPKESK